jgi:hypothetical protein
MKHQENCYAVFDAICSIANARITLHNETVIRKRAEIIKSAQVIKHLCA